VAEAMFSCDVDGFFMEVDSARAGGFEPLRFLPQCGFSSTRHGNQLTEDEQWRKLERVIEVAGEVWR
jgi:hypothetical protein